MLAGGCQHGATCAVFHTELFQLCLYVLRLRLTPPTKVSPNAHAERAAKITLENNKPGILEPGARRQQILKYLLH